MDRLKRGDIHLCEFASPDKRRAVVILTRDSYLNLLTSVTVAKVTSTIRGVNSEVYLDEHDEMKGPCAANLHQVFTVPVGQIGKRITGLGPERMQELCKALNFALGCD